MRAHAPPQILLGASPQVIHAALLTAGGERHDLAIGGIGLHVVDRWNGVGSVAEGGVGRDVIHPFACRYFKFTVNVSNDRIYEQLTPASAPPRPARSENRHNGMVF
jgi:hypothetical protein